MQTTTRLMRSRNDKMIAGVSSGVAQYLGLDPVLVRLAFVLLAFSGASLLIYPLLWMVMPEESAGSPTGSVPGVSTPGQVFVAAGTPTQRLRLDPLTGAPLGPEEIPIQNLGAGPASGAGPANQQRILGWVLLGIGGFIALKMLLPGAGALLVPVLLIGAGIWLLRKP